MYRGRHCTQSEGYEAEREFTMSRDIIKNVSLSFSLNEGAAQDRKFGGDSICRGRPKRRYEQVSLGLSHDPDQGLPPMRSCDVILVRMGSSEHSHPLSQESIVLPKGTARPCCLSSVFLYSCSSSWRTVDPLCPSLGS